MKSFISFSNKFGQNDKSLRFRHTRINQIDKGLFRYTHWHSYLGAAKIKKKSLRSVQSNQQMSFFNKIVNLSMYAGLKHKAFLTLINVFTKLIYVLKFEQSSDKLKYLSSKYLDFILIKSLRCKTSVTANDLLANLVHDVHPLFSLKTQKVKIKKRTKQKQRYKIRICYVKPKSRALVVLKWLVSGASWFSSQK